MLDVTIATSQSIPHPAVAFLSSIPYAKPHSHAFFRVLAYAVDPSCTIYAHTRLSYIC